MASKHFTERKEVDKQLGTDKLELQEKLNKDHKDQKDSPDNKQKHEKEKQEKNERGEQTEKNLMDDKAASDTKHKQEKDKNEKEKEAKAEKDSKEHNKTEHKDHPFETVRSEFVASNPMPGSPAQPASNPMPGFGQPLFGPGMGHPTPKPLADKPLKEFVKELLEHKGTLKELHLEVKHPSFETQPLNDPFGPVEQRLVSLEATVGHLLHFIPQSLRPDLNQGALQQEADVATSDTAQADKPASKTIRRAKKKATAAQG